MDIGRGTCVMWFGFGFGIGLGFGLGFGFGLGMAGGLREAEGR